MKTRRAGNGRAQQNGGVWRFSLGAGHGYHLAQLDDYVGQPRRSFSQHAPLHISVGARASHASLPGTWGIGLWNDPFGFSIGQGAGLQLPALPNAAWFFFASQRNHLSLDDQLPGNGSLASVYRSPRIPSLLLSPTLLALPLLAIPSAARLLRRVAGHLIRQEAAALAVEPTQWHTYELVWHTNNVEFRLDGQSVLHTTLAPQGPLSLLIWLDNQYAAWQPDGSLHYGVEPTQPDSWLEIRDLQVE